MRFKDLIQILEALHERRQVSPHDDGKMLEEELMRSHANLYPKKESWKMFLNPLFPVGRAVLTASILVGLVVAACAVPTSHEAEVGKSFHAEIDGTMKELPVVGEIVDLVEGSGLVEEISVSMNERSPGNTMIDMLAWGTSVEDVDLPRLLASAFPRFTGVAWDVSPLSGEVETSIARKLGQKMFNFEIDLDRAEIVSARQQILDQLAAQGIDGDAEVTIVEENGTATIDLKLCVDPGEDGAGFEEGAMFTIDVLGDGCSTSVTAPGVIDDSASCTD